MSYLNCPSPLLCSSGAVTLVSETRLSLMYCAILMYAFTLASDQKISLIISYNSLPHFQLKVLPPSTTYLKVYLKP